MSPISDLDLNKCQGVGRSVGKSLPKPDAVAKVRGEAMYVADMTRPEMLIGKVLRSDRAHARIKAINIGKAMHIPGVVAVLTASDIPGKNRIGDSNLKDRPVLASERVRFYGEALALVAAVDMKAAEKGLSAIEVEYEDLPVLTSPGASLEPGAPALHPEGNICSRRLVVRGDCAGALSRADLVVANTYTTQWVDHAYLETNAALAEWVDGRLVVWVTTKSVHEDQGEITRVLGLPAEKVRVIAATIGGSFGGKSDQDLVCMASLLSYHTGRPVKIVYTREEDLQVTTKRHPYSIRYTHGVTADGRLLAVKMELTADAGAYTSYSPSVVTRAVIHGTGPYRVPNVYLEGKSVFTNNPVTGAMRGYGTPQVTFACESQMDILAGKLGIDPFELRARNILCPGDAISCGQILGPGAAKEALDLCRELQVNDRAGLNDKDCNAYGDGRRRKAWGIGTFFYGNGRTAQHNPGVAEISLGMDGVFRLCVGSPDIGQGSDTAMAQIAAESLGVDTSLIQVISADTGLTRDSGTTSGTRLTYIVGKGVEMAACKLREILMESAARAMGVEKDALVLYGDKILLRKGKRQKQDNESGRPDSACIRLKDLAVWAEQTGIYLLADGRFDPPTTPLDPDTGCGIPYGAYTFGTQCARVTVDTLTGKLNVDKIIAVYDVGTPVNPRLLEAQIEGGCAGGVGYGVMEEILLRDGKVVNNNFDAFLIPTSKDMPRVNSYIVPNREETGSFGAKGIGEPALVPTAAAIANAVAAATGVRIMDLPITPERFLAGLQERGCCGKTLPAPGAEKVMPGRDDNDKS